MKNKNRILLSAIIAFASFASSSSAADGTWSAGATGTWDTTDTNWTITSDGTPWDATDGPGNTAIFNDTTTATISDTVYANGLTFGGATTANTLTAGTLDFGSANAPISITNNAKVTINSTLAGSGNLNFTSANGNGGWDRGVTLGADNASTFTGKMAFTNISGYYFFVFASNDNNFGATPGSFTADAITFNGTTLKQTGSSLTFSANRGITIGSGGLSVHGSGTMDFNSVITGAGGISLDFSGGTKVANLNAVNTFNGEFQPSGGKVVIGVDNALPHGAGKGNVWFRAWSSQATIDLNGHELTINGVYSQGATYDATSGFDNSAAGNATLIFGDNNATTSFLGVIKNTGAALSVTKIGTGTQTLTGNLSYTGATTVNAGTLVISGTMAGASSLVANSGGTLRADLATNTAGVFNSASTVALGGGTLNIKGKSTDTSSQTLGDLTLSANTGASKISITPNGGAGTTLTLGNTWTGNAGNTLLIDLSAAGSTLTSSPTTANGIIGGYAFVKDATTTGFATVSSGNVVRYTGATTLDETAAASDLDPATNYVVPTGVGLSGPSAPQTVNSLEIGNGGIVIGDGQTLTVASGGLLFNNPGGSNWAAISGYKLTSGTSDLTVYTIPGNGYQIYAQITGNIALVKDGPGGLIFSGANDYTGDTVILAGGVNGIVPFGAGKGNLLVNSGATFDLAAGSKSINGLSQSTGAIGGTVTNTWGGPQTLTLGNGDATASFNGVISGTGGNALSLTKVGTGTQTLSGANTYSGATTVSAGTLTLGKANTGNDASTVTIASTGATLNLTYTGTDMVDKLFIGATQLAAGVYGKTGSVLPVIGIAQITGDGTLTVASGPVGSDYAAWANDPLKGNIPGEPADGDFDNDGIANIMEYALGMDPRTSSQPAGVLSGNTITYTKGTDAIANGDVSWVIETSQTLATGSWTPVVTQPAGDTNLTISYTLTPGSPAENFARLKVVAP